MNGLEYAYRCLGRYASAGLLGAALLVGAGAAPALAQWGHDRDRDDRGYRDDTARSVVLEGYREGYERGRADRDRGLDFDATHDEEYEEGGFARSAERRSLFRRGYEEGYSDGYYRRDFDGRAADDLDFSSAPGYGGWRNDDRYEDDRYDDDRDGRIGRTDVLRIAQMNGYSEGYENGVVDRANRRGMSFSSRMEYRRATTGYQREFGYLGEYQSAFRQAYSRGYQDAYHGRRFDRSFDRARIYSDYGRYGYDPYYNAPSYRSAPVRSDVREMAERAARQGFDDGYLRGQYDRQIGARRPNPQGHGAYEHALNGWNPEWGGASTYQEYYRSFFVQGYEQGFNGRARGAFVFRSL